MGKALLKITLIMRNINLNSQLLDDLLMYSYYLHLKPLISILDFLRSKDSASLGFAFMGRNGVRLWLIVILVLVLGFTLEVGF